MKTFSALALAALVACGSSSSSSSSQQPSALPTSLDLALGKRLDTVVDGAIAKGGVGLVLVVARDGKIVYERAAGYADREAKVAMRLDTLFRLASMTKPIVSAAAMALVEQGKLSLEDPVTRWLPKFRPVLADGSAAVITVRHLITHTSGLGYKFDEDEGGPMYEAGVSDGLAEPGMTMAENLERLARVPLYFAPGTTWRYSISIDVLGAVVAAAGGGTLPEVVARLITRPLGMTDATFVVTDRERIAWPYAPNGREAIRMTEPFDRKGGPRRGIRFSPARIFDATSFPSGGAGMAGTARDYLVFCEALRTGGANILRPETVRAMTSNQVGSLQVDPGEGFGYGFGVILDPAAARSLRGKGTFAWGGIYGTTFWVDPEARMSVVLLTNVAGDLPDDDVAKVLYAR